MTADVRPFDPAILRLLPRSRRPVALLGLLGVLNGALAIGQAFSIAAAVVSVVTDGDLIGPTVALLAVAMARAATGAAAEATAARAGVRVSTALRQALLDAALVRSAAMSATELRTLAVNGATSVEPYVARFLPALVSAAVLPVLAIATLVAVDWPSALIVVGTVPLLPLFAALIGHATADATQRRWQALRALSGHFLDVVRGLPVLVSYGRAGRQVGEIRRVGDRHRAATMATLRLAFLSSAALELLATISVAMVAVAVGLRLAAGQMDLHTGLLAILLAPEAYWPIRRVGAEFHAAADGAAAVADSLVVLARGAEPAGTELVRREPVARAAAGADSTDPQPIVRARGVHYRYPGADSDVLAGINLTAGPGLTVITGPSGCGKSTVLELLAGLRVPTRGTLRAPRAHLVSQRPFLIPGTIRENLVLPGDRSDGDLREALARVGLDALVAALPHGLDSMIGDDGFGLSAGQRARLGLARALLTDAPLVLLDEPTAHLDVQAATLVQQAVRDLADSRIVIAATHRSGLVETAERRYAMTSAGCWPVSAAARTTVSTPVSAFDPATDMAASWA